MSIDKIKRNIKKIQKSPKLFLHDFTDKRFSKLITSNAKLNSKLNTVVILSHRSIDFAFDIIKDVNYKKQSASSIVNFDEKPPILELEKKSFQNNSRVDKNNISIKFEQKSLLDTEKEIYNFVSNYPVNTLKIGDEYLWPYLRSHLLVDLYSSWMGRERFRELNPRSVNTWYHSNFPLKFRQKMKVEFNAKDYNQLVDHESEILFFVQNNGFGRVEIAGEFYHRLVDPLYEECIKLGLSSKKIEVLQGSRSFDFLNTWHKLHHPSLFILPPNIAEVGYSNSLRLDELFFEKYEENITSLYTPSIKLINEVIDFELHSRKWFKEMLVQLKPKVVFVACYHYWGSLISAAHELGILTVDIQHGVYGDNGVLYNNHEEIPFEGYQAYPDFFAVWGKKEFNKINSNFKRANKHHPIMMGNPWLERLKKFPDTLSPSMLKELQTEKITVLITLRDQSILPSLYREIITETKHSVKWFIRHHPTTRNIFTKNDFSHKHDIIIDEEVDKVIFSELFKHIDITLSEGSSLALEALYYGVKSVVFTETGYSVFKEEIKEGKIDYIKNASDFDKLINNSESEKIIDESFGSLSVTDFIINIKSIADKKREKINPYVFANEYYIERYKDHIRKLVSRVCFKDSDYIEENIAAFQEICNYLEMIQISTKKLMSKDDEYAIEARRFTSIIREEFGPSGFNVFLISDSLQLPRLAIKSKNSTLVKSTTNWYFNSLSQNIFDNELKMLSWSQRYFTTEKLLFYWDNIIPSLEGSHAVVHLGSTESIQNTLLEKHRIGLSFIENKDKLKILNINKNIKEIMKQRMLTHSEVKVEEFRVNIKKIISKLRDDNVTSINFINLHQVYSNKGIFNISQLNLFKEFNNVLESEVINNKDINLINFDDLLGSNTYNEIVSVDGVHLTKLGHEILAKEILRTLHKYS